MIELVNVFGNMTSLFDGLVSLMDEFLASSSSSSLDTSQADEEPLDSHRIKEERDVEREEEHAPSSSMLQTLWSLMIDSEDEHLPHHDVPLLNDPHNMTMRSKLQDRTIHLGQLSDRLTATTTESHLLRNRVHEFRTAVVSQDDKSCSCIII